MCRGVVSVIGGGGGGVTNKLIHVWRGGQITGERSDPHTIHLFMSIEI